jgi:hypothetical protein
VDRLVGLRLDERRLLSGAAFDRLVICHLAAIARECRSEFGPALMPARDIPLSAAIRGKTGA